MIVTVSVAASPSVTLPFTLKVLSRVVAPVTSNVPAKSALAPLKVTAVVGVEPDLIAS